MRKNGGPEFECLWLFPLQNGKIVPSLPRTMKKTRNLSIIFLIIYMYLNLVNNQRLMSQHIDNSQAVTTLNFWTDYEKKYMLFSINFAWNGTPFPHHMYKWIIFMINKKIFVYWVKQFKSPKMSINRSELTPTILVNIKNILAFKYLIIFCDLKILRKKYHKWTTGRYLLYIIKSTDQVEYFPK